MLLLVLGLIIFLGIHSTLIFAPSVKSNFVAHRGALAWRAIYSVLALLGLVLIIIGYGASRQAPVMVWVPPVGLAHLALLLTLPAFIFLAAAYVPNNHLKAKMGHPMYLAIKTWALAHLLANGMLADILLFGSFLAWAIAGFAVRRKQDRKEAKQYPQGTMGGTIATVIVGLVTWGVFAFYLHTILIGVNPMPM
jgi:uncharacterized membrane protein